MKILTGILLGALMLTLGTVYATKDDFITNVFGSYAAVTTNIFGESQYSLITQEKEHPSIGLAFVRLSVDCPTVMMVMGIVDLLEEPADTSNLTPIKKGFIQVDDMDKHEMTWMYAYKQGERAVNVLFPQIANRPLLSQTLLNGTEVVLSFDFGTDGIGNLTFPLDGFKEGINFTQKQCEDTPQGESEEPEETLEFRVPLQSQPKTASWVII